jgi:hypothetical protein
MTQAFDQIADDAVCGLAFDPSGFAGGQLIAVGSDRLRCQRDCRRALDAVERRGNEQARCEPQDIPRARR